MVDSDGFQSDDSTTHSLPHTRFGLASSTPSTTCLIGAVPTTRIRAQRVTPTIAVSCLTTSSNNKAVNTSSASREVLFASTGLRRVSDQLLQCSTLCRELQRLEAFSVGAGIVVDVARCRDARSICSAVEIDDIGLRRGEEGGAADEDGCECFHGG